MSMWGAGPDPASPPVVGMPVGSAGPEPSATSVEPPVVVRRPRWVLPALVIMGAVTIAALTYASLSLARGEAGLLPFADSRLRSAHEACGSTGELSDGDRTLYLDVAGEEAGSGELTVVDLACYLAELEAPDYIVRQMESTRALDGRQSDTWGSFEASWTYHPDDGLDVLIRQIG